MSIAEAKRMHGILFSGIRAIFERAAQLERSGRDIIHMEIGRPDFDTPEHIKAAAYEALRLGKVHYTSNYGLLELRQAIAAKLERDNGLIYDPENELLVTVGLSEAVHLAICAFVDPGEEIIVFEPTWINYEYVPAMLGVSVEVVPLKWTDHFQLNLSELERHIKPNTRMIVVISPHNPTGSVFEINELIGIAELAKRHNLIVLSDEIYEKITYDGFKHISIASLSGMRERSIVLNGFSKSYSMTGWRLGYIAASADLLMPQLRAHQYLTTCACSFGQAGAIAALNGPQDCVNAMVAEFQRRRNMVVKELNNIPGVLCHMPRGAFYAFADVSAYKLSSEEIAWHLLEVADVALVPGEAFGFAGRGYLRLSFANSYEHLAEGVARVSSALNELRD